MINSQAITPAITKLKESDNFREKMAIKNPSAVANIPPAPYFPNLSISFNAIAFD
jgi:hypothetical protein